MSVFFGEDLRASILTRINDGTNGIVNQLTLINTARTENTPMPADIDPPYETQNSYQIFVDLNDNTFEENPGAHWEVARDVYELILSTVIKGTDIPTMRLYGERYIEAVLKCLSGYSVDPQSGDYYIVAHGCKRPDRSLHDNATSLEFKVIFSVHRNKQ